MKNNKNILIGLILVFLLGTLLWYHQSLKEFSEAINIYLVMVLVGVTAYYAYLTRLSLRETQKDRSLHVRPIIVPSSLIIHDENAQGGDNACMAFETTNIGNGPAFSIHVIICDPETGKTLAKPTHHIDYLTKDGKTDDNHIHINNDKLRNINYKEIDGEFSALITLKVHYDDTFGKTYASERNFSLEKDGHIFSPVLGSFKLNSSL